MKVQKRFNNLNSFIKYGFLMVILGTLLGCEGVPSHDPDRNYKSIEKALLSKLMLAKDSTVIQLEEGHFIFKSSLILDNKKHFTLRGRGMDKTVLSFKIQENGAEGLKITNSENIILEDFTIEDAVGDNIKITDTKGITIRRIKSAWTGEISKKNGAYALYPVICENVLIEACEVLGASDAGIYVGQSKNVIIRNNKVYWNVAGIESENSENVSIYNNQAYNNTGGILVFDLPGLTRYGRKIKVYDNEVYDNNLFNFAPPGNIVGAYALIDAMNDQKSQENKDPVSSAQIFEEGANMDLEYDPYPGAIYIHDNTYGEVSWLPNLSNDFGKLFLWKFGFDRPQIIWDGMVPENYLLSNGTLNPDYKICIREAGVKTALLDAANDFEGLLTNPESFNCEI